MSDLKESQMFRMAVVDSIPTTRPRLKFYGESSASSKAYPFLSSYSPRVGDRVLTARVDGSYVILGRIT